MMQLVEEHNETMKMKTMYTNDPNDVQPPPTPLTPLLSVKIPTNAHTTFCGPTLGTQATMALDSLSG